MMSCARMQAGGSEGRKPLFSSPVGHGCKETDQNKTKLLSFNYEKDKKQRQNHSQPGAPSLWHSADCVSRDAEPP